MFKKTILKNGLRLLTVTMQGVDTATSLVLIGVGSRYENKKNNGIAHLIEHLAFKGTKKRPDLFTVARELDSIGAGYNAFTGEEYTGYYVKSRAAHLEKGLEIISDIVQNPLYREENIAEEQKVIIEEIRMYYDSPTHYANQLMQNILFAGNSLGYDIAGSEKSVSGIKRNNILDFRVQSYQLKNMVVVVAGKIKDKIEHKVETLFPAEAKEKTNQKAIFKPQKDAKKIMIDKRKTQQSHLRLGVHGIKIEDPDRYAVDLLNLILGGSMSSRLFEEIREKRSLAYYINTTAESYCDTGYFIVQAGLNTARLEEATKIIKSELEKSTKEIKDEELSRAKEILKGQMAMEKEDSQELAWFFGFQELLESKTKTYDEIIKKIDKIEKSDIKRAAKRIFSQEFYLVLVGQGDEEKLLKLIR
jgi:predicted Zn-dependent peptidase